MPPTDTIWITWEGHRRSRVLASALGVPLHEITTSKRGIARYLALLPRTARLLFETRPSTVISQNPSMVLALYLSLLRPVMRYRWIVDAHNEAVRPYMHDGWLVRLISRRLLRKADISVVTNASLAADVIRHGGRPLVLPDGLPEVPDVPARQFGPGLHVLAIATFAADEPIAEIIDAARGLPEDFHIHFTGNACRANFEIETVPGNVHFLGYLPEADYWAAIRGCDAVLDLSLMPDCLVCGAYEALAAGKPMLLSDNQPCRELFGSAAIFSVADRASIRDALIMVASERSAILQRIPSARASFSAGWQESLQSLLDSIDRLAVQRYSDACKSSSADSQARGSD